MCLNARLFLVVERAFNLFVERAFILLLNARLFLFGTRAYFFVVERAFLFFHARLFVCL